MWDVSNECERRDCPGDANMEIVMENFIVVCTFNDANGKLVVRTFPEWECEDMPGRIADVCAKIANEIGTAEFDVTVRPINP